MYSSTLCKYIYGIAIVLLLLVPCASRSQTQVIRGRVTDTDSCPLAFSTIRLSEQDLVASTANDGRFSLLVTARNGTFLIEISHVGKQILFKQAKAGEFLAVQLKDKSLTLAEVQVSVNRRNGSTPSSIVYNREAIEQLQAFSLTEVLNTLPGKAATPPALQTPQTLTLRANATGNHALSNSLELL